MGAAYGQMNYHEQALHYYDRALEINPGYVKALYGKTVALKNLKKVAFELRSSIIKEIHNQFDEIDEKTNANMGIYHTYLQNADNGDLSSLEFVTKFFFNIDAYGLGVYFGERAANAGIANSQFMLGMAYAEAKGVEEDLEKAAYCYTKAANQGHVDALNNLGHLYKDGLGVEKNEKLAFYYIEKAAKDNSVNAFEGLGSCYYFGIGIAKDVDQAEFWWKKAAQEGDKEAIQNLERYFSRSTLSRD